MIYLQMKQIIVSKYSSKEHLIETLIKSSHIPFVIDGSPLYKNRYSDGYTPYLFPNSNKKVLFITLLTIKRFKTTLYIKNEVNIWSRVLHGVVDINNFYSELPCEFCSYMNNWNICNFANIHFRELWIVLIGFSYKQYTKWKNSLPDYLLNNVYLTRFNEIFEILYKNIFSYMILYIYIIYIYDNMWNCTNWRPTPKIYQINTKSLNIDVVETRTVLDHVN